MTSSNVAETHAGYCLLLIQLYGVNAQTDGNHVVTVADANWTLFLQDEWMIKLFEWEVSGYNTPHYFSQIHTHLTNTLGIPSWCSYVIFVIITLFMVLVLGLMLVLIADWIWPSRPKRKDNKTVLTVKEDVSDEEVEDILSEYKRTSDLDNESERADESIEEEGQITDSYSELPPPEGAAENSARKRNLQETNTSEGT